MPANTPKGYPYPLGTDRVMDGDDSIHNLATAIDTTLGVAASGTVAINVATGGTIGTAAVTFPVGRFTAAPKVMTTNDGSNPNVLTCAQSPTVNGFTANGTRASSGNVQCMWLAVQV